MTSPLPTSPSDGQRVLERFIPLGLFVVLLWLVEIVDQVWSGASLQSNGIHPRDFGRIDGILWSPFLHSDWGHLIANTAPLLILGALLLLRGPGRWLAATAFLAVVGGAITWLIGGSGNHIGASGVVFGYFGILVGTAVFERNLRAAAIALVAVMMYGGLWIGLIPRNGVSWEGHLGGLIAGLIFAKLTAQPRSAPEPELPVRGDEYWLEGTPDL